MTVDAAVVDRVVSSGFRYWPAKIIFVMESDKFKCVFDVGLGGRFKRTCFLDTTYSPPDPHSMNSVEQEQAKVAKFFVMDTFMGLDGVAVVQERGERVAVRSLLYPGTTSHEVARLALKKSGDFVDMGAYLEVMRAHDFDPSKSDFKYGGSLWTQK